MFEERWFWEPMRNAQGPKRSWCVRNKGPGGVAPKNSRPRHCLKMFEERWSWEPTRNAQGPKGPWYVRNKGPGGIAPKNSRRRKCWNMLEERWSWEPTRNAQGPKGFWYVRNKGPGGIAPKNSRSRYFLENGGLGSRCATLGVHVGPLHMLAKASARAGRAGGSLVRKP